MVPYYNELDTGLCLPVISKNRIDHNLDNTTMQAGFFIKYNVLFELIDNLKYILNGILLDDIKLSDLDSNIRKILFIKLKDNILSLSKLNISTVSDFRIVELEKYLTFWGENLDSLYNLGLYQIKSNEYIKTMQLFNDALIEIADKRKKLVDVPLPNTWLITSNGSLYNTNSTKHSEGRFRDYYDEFNQMFFDGKLKFNDNDSKLDPLPELGNSEIINNNGYVRDIILDILLHYLDYIEFNGKSFDSKYLKIVTGMIEIRLDYYNFLKKLQIYTSNPTEELKKIIALTKNNYDDVLLRCCGVSKVIGAPVYTIVTSQLNYEREFEKYISNGWNISYVNPLIINREKGIVEEYSSDFLEKRIRYYH